MKLIPLLASLLALLPAASFAYDPKAGPQVPLQAGEWWNEPYPTPFDIKQLKQPQAAISVKGNALVNDKGQTVVLRGVNIADPDKLARQGKWDKSLFEAAKSFGSNTIRLPIHPIAWRTRGSADYLKLLDQAVLWANELQLYLIIDWHSMGNLVKEQYFHPMYVTNAQETREFWRTIAFRYSEVPTVAVYELFNEPTHNFGKLGEMDWQAWRQFNEELISMIQAHDKTSVSLVAGFNWAYDLSPVKDAPIRREGVAYAIHPYPQKTKGYPKAWEEQWGHLAATYPLIATELGWMREGEKGAHIPVLDDGSYGPIITRYLREKGLSYTFWCFDPDWAPPLISDWNYTLTEQGKQFKAFLLEEAKTEAKNQKKK